MCTSCDGSDHQQPIKQSSSPTKVLLFTQNTTRNPISWNPALRQPNPNEVLHSVHLALHHALDPCVNNSGEPCSWTITRTTEDETTNGNGTILIPRPTELKPHVFAPTDHPEISVRLRFYGGHGGLDRKKHIDEALKHLSEATGFKEIDRFVIGFDGIRWAGGDAECEDGGDEVDVLMKQGIWEHISSKPELKKIGVSDFSWCHLNRLFAQLPPPGSVRRPTIDQLNFDRDLPESLATFSKTEKIELLSHSDNRVPYEGIEVLLDEFKDRLPLPASFADLRSKGSPAIEMHWVMKYTIVLKDRGLLADKGFILSLSFRDN